ncbi:conserved hypothetical protein [Candidatus Desulfarcum epimagneticum]|uniref:ATPase n=1 Tax=uncultured Desulfobacteraceae bacterium TaxID=218296 RepID=A0A484HFF1_9BACT|nr:conserved hypothetical protein [uncultured Desulfobacteraceae bacterium]
MKRAIDDILKEWKDSRTRQPLLVRGARQVGKTHSVTAFGRACFDGMATVNFEERPEFARCFSDFDPRAIIDRLSVLTGADITPGRTLLFLDEIQDCPEAIMSLRYFYEKMPRLHVIGAGSLMEFALSSTRFRMPVGRVQSVYMFPVSFDGFLGALGEDKMRRYLRGVHLKDGVEKTFKSRLENLARRYFFTGGMPGVVSAFSDRVSATEIQRLQSGLIMTYSEDFAKYASKAKHKYLKDVYRNAPRMVGRRYKYSHVNPNVETKFLKEALDLLCDARCLARIRHASGAGTPLSASADERKFKISFLDVGLMQRALHTQEKTITGESIMTINAGAAAEQFVAQELFARRDPYSEPRLHFWVREARGSAAEVDFLIEEDGLALPVEVKSGARGSLKSMRLFLDRYPKTPLGIRYSMHDLSYCDRLLSIPLYMIGHTGRLLRESLDSR